VGGPTRTAKLVDGSDYIGGVGSWDCASPTQVALRDIRRQDVPPKHTRTTEEPAGRESPPKSSSAIAT